MYISLIFMAFLNFCKNNQYVTLLLSFLAFFSHKIQKGHIHVESGYLAYVTIMSLVPLMLVMFSIMTVFPIFNELATVLENFVYANFVPTSGSVVQEHVNGFVNNASKMSAVAIMFLFLLAMLLISSIDSTLNKLWGVTEKRSTITSFSMYWMVLTLGPVLMGSSIAASSYVISIVSSDSESFIGIGAFIVRLLPWLASIAMFFFLYTVVPNTRVSFKSALSGAAFATILFEIAKKSFAFYVIQLPSYQTIYGTLATIPILFLWVYLSWLVVLLGAQFTVSLQEFPHKIKDL